MTWLLALLAVTLAIALWALGMFIGLVKTAKEIDEWDRSQ